MKGGVTEQKADQDSDLVEVGHEVEGRRDVVEGGVDQPVERPVSKLVLGF